jgi:hypothetical protein
MTQKPIHDNPQAMCPLWRKPCVKVCHTCEWWDFLRIADPLRPGQQIDKWMCAMRKVGDLGLANLQAQRETTAETHELRNDVDKQNAGAMVGVIGHLNGQMRETLTGIEQADPQKLLERVS